MTDECMICGTDLSYSVVAEVRGYCDVCKPNKCQECGCIHIKQDIQEETKWYCDNGCKFIVEG